MNGKENNTPKSIYISHSKLALLMKKNSVYGSTNQIIPLKYKIEYNEYNVDVLSIVVLVYPVSSLTH